MENSIFSMNIYENKIRKQLRITNSDYRSWLSIKERRGVLYIEWKVLVTSVVTRMVLIYAV